ncbi:MAG: hypothetical protein IH851_03010 [Armatimonadetes bacterium]|nr:hypothetical protein [Armatimonadota bacterium]
MRTLTLLLTGLAGLALLAPLAAQRPQRTPDNLKEGDKAPDFSLTILHTEKKFTLSDNFGKRPTLLIFGSYT